MTNKEKAKSKERIIKYIVEDWATDHYENAESCETCPLCEEECPVAEYDGYEFYPTNGAYCTEEILKVIGSDD